ncbi:MAG: heavy-metal-associated domain-containing protein [Chloroflexota bacterium]|nr:heavy-metal-associated domain-containing protein [Lentimicrobium sp.]
MKKLTGFLVLIFVFITGSLIAQNSKNSVIDINVSSQCNMCKERLEKMLAFEKGVVNSNLDVETHTLKVTYKPTKTTPEAIKKAISLTGYDADDVAADAKAYAKLPDCCKKKADRKDPNAVEKH